ncbi:MAG TPA: ankyrin repeat domain-containing protein [Bacteroidales bacterium]|nr:ankyrin repeat domain-containing protein [Bacteroidales bacterium]
MQVVSPINLSIVRYWPNFNPELTTNRKMLGILRYLLPIILIALSAQAEACASITNSNDSLILASVKNGDISNLNDLFRLPIDLNREYGKEKRTLLAYAIENGQVESVTFLIDKGADIEQPNENKTPLMYAARYGSTMITEILLREGANINFINGDRNTAFHYAAKYNNLEVLKILYENGAKINIPNWDNWTALDYAIINSNEEIQDWLRMIGCLVLKKNIPDYFDGPYIDVPDTGRLSIKYLVNKERKQKSSFISEEIPVVESEIRIDGLKKDKKEYYITLNPEPPPCRYIEQSSVFVIGDIHGQYDRMVKMLISGEVIDKDLHWIWGDRHLVFVGDILDRGEGVMEALWLIYNLEREAEVCNGKVHMLIGNHEAMIIKNDIRYIANKYYSLTSNLNIDYYSLFSENTILGRWLRSKNVVEIIGNTMFIHAGISPELAAQGLSIEEINDSFREYLKSGLDSINPDLINILRGNLGPVWYRGYIKSGSGYPEIEMGQLDSILNQYSAKKVVVGHTEVDEILPLKNGKVIPVNIPLANKRILEQALLIEEDVLYRLTTEKSKTIMK